MSASYYGANYNSYDPGFTEVFLWSGVVWVPYTIFLFYLFYEQLQAKRYPQYIILLFLALGTITRCAWFFGSSTGSKSELVYTVLNRLAILFQFTAMSMLILMWSRVVKIKSSGPTLTKSLLFDNEDPQARCIVGTLLAINMLTWLFVISTNIGAELKHSEKLYDANIVLLAALCFMEAITIFSVGLYTGLRISRELTPVYMTGGSGGSVSVSIQAKGTSRCSCFNEIYVFLRGIDKGEERLRMQNQVLRKLVILSSILSFFFLIRSFAFIYGTYIFM